MGAERQGGLQGGVSEKSGPKERVLGRLGVGRSLWTVGEAVPLLICPASSLGLMGSEPDGPWSPGSWMAPELSHFKAWQPGLECREPGWGAQADGSEDNDHRTLLTQPEVWSWLPGSQRAAVVGAGSLPVS